MEDENGFRESLVVRLSFVFAGLILILLDLVGEALPLTSDKRYLISASISVKINLYYCIISSMDHIMHDRSVQKSNAGVLGMRVKGNIQVVLPVGSKIDELVCLPRLQIIPLHIAPNHHFISCSAQTLFDSIANSMIGPSLPHLICTHNCAAQIH